jgi:hypothetical protein
MSGHKVATVTISQEEYRKLFEAEKNLRYSMNEMALLENNSIADETRSIFDQMLSFNQQQLTQYSSSDEIIDHQSEIEHLRNLYDIQFNELQQIIAHQNELLHMGDIDKQKDIESLSNQIIKLSQRMDDVNAQVTAQTSLDEKIGGSIQEIVQEYLDEIDFYRQSLSEYNANPGSIPGLMVRIEEGMDLAIYNASHGYLDASLSLLQNLVLDAKEGLRKVELDQSLKFFLSTNLRNRLISINQRIFKNSLVEAVTREGNLTGVYLDLKDWSDGKYQVALSDVDNLVHWLDVNYDSASYDELKKLENFIGTAEANFEDAIHTARLNAINSQLKYEVANQILLALVSQGYIPDEGAYADNNGEERYCAKAVNGDGSSVTIFIDSADQVQIGSKISIISSDYQQKTQTELQHRAMEIREAVSQYGLGIGVISEIPIQNEGMTDKRKVRYTTKVRTNR